MIEMLLAAVLVCAVEETPEKLMAKAGADYNARRFTEAVKLLTEAIKKDPTLAEAYDRRGSANFMAGHFKEAVDDFDRFVKLRPMQWNGHWRRGIALYYVGRHEDGYKQFEGYEKVDASDVENTFWHWMCYSKKHGVEKARKVLLRTGKDRRTPMNEVLALIQGKIKPEDVLAAAEAGDLPEVQRKPQLFYAHLYLGLYHEQMGDKKKALHHLGLASSPKYRGGSSLAGGSGYMGEVARLHHDWLKAKK